MHKKLKTQNILSVFSFAFIVKVNNTKKATYKIQKCFRNPDFSLDTI